MSTISMRLVSVASNELRGRAVVVMGGEGVRGPLYIRNLLVDELAAVVRQIDIRVHGGAAGVSENRARASSVSSTWSGSAANLLRGVLDGLARSLA